MPDSQARFCFRCGNALATLWPVVPAVGTLLRIAAPLAAGLASFLPWLTIGVVTRTRHWNAYHIGDLAWAWLIVDAAAVVLAAASSKLSMPLWLTLSWAMLGALSLGVGVAGFVLASVSAHVSTILSAPNPLSVSYGLYVFTAACAVWCAAGWGPWPHPARRKATPVD